MESSKGKLIVGTLSDRSTCAAALPSALTDLRERFEHADLSIRSHSEIFPW